MSRPSAFKSDELRVVAIEFAELALAHYQQDGRLKIRQREQLRRALAAAAQALSWDIQTSNPVGSALADAHKVAQIGVEAMSDVLAEELTEKKAEIKELQKFQKSIAKLGKSAEYPMEVSYKHTARDASKGYATKTEVVVLEDAQGAEDLAGTVEKRLDSWEKLRDQMLVDMKQKQKQIKEMDPSVTPFVEGLKGLIREVLATTLY